MPRAQRDFSPIYSTEQVLITFDFSAALAVSETPVSQTTSISVISGIDANPNSRLIGGPGIIGAAVVQMIGTLQTGATYDISATVSTSAGQILTLNAHQACLANT